MPIPFGFGRRASPVADPHGRHAEAARETGEQFPQDLRAAQAADSIRRPTYQEDL